VSSPAPRGGNTKGKEQETEKMNCIRGRITQREGTIGEGRARHLMITGGG